MKFQTGKEVHPHKGDEYAATLYDLAFKAEAKLADANKTLRTNPNIENLKRANRLAVASKKAAKNYKAWIDPHSD